MLKSHNMKKFLALAILAGLLGMAGCSPAADEGAVASAGGSTEGAGEYESLEPVDVKTYNDIAPIGEYIPEDVNLSGAKEDGTKWKIAWCAHDLADESAAYIDGLTKEYAEKYGFDLVSFDAQADPQKQFEQINNAINQHVDAIIIQPLDETSACIPMKKARDAGIHVVNIQQQASDEESFDVYVGPDDTMAGRLIASMLLDHQPDGGKIVIIEGYPGSTPQINRTKGFMGVIQNYDQYEILEIQASAWSTTESMNIMESYLSKYPEIDAVYSQFDLGTLAAIKAADNAGRADDIEFYSVDGTDGALEEIAKGGAFYGTAFQPFTSNTEIGVMAALALCNGDGDKLEKFIMAPYVCITKDNASNFTAGWG